MRKIIKRCNCGRLLGDNRSQRCFKCAHKEHSLFMTGKNNPMYGKLGVLSSQFKGGKPHCKDCGKITSRRGIKRCLKCYNKWRAIAENNNNYISGNSIALHYCIDCKKPVIDYHAKRCLRCSNINNSKCNATRIKYGAIFFKSGWEVAFAKYLDGLGVRWLYEPKTFDLGNTTYTPDFYLSKFNLYVEIKGYWRKDAKKKVRLFKKLFPTVLFKILEEKELLKYKIIVPYKKLKRRNNNV